MGDTNMVHTSCPTLLLRLPSLMCLIIRELVSWTFPACLPLCSPSFSLWCVPLQACLAGFCRLAPCLWCPASLLALTLAASWLASCLLAGLPAFMGLSWLGTLMRFRTAPLQSIVLWGLLPRQQQLQNRQGLHWTDCLYQRPLCSNKLVALLPWCRCGMCLVRTVRKAYTTGWQCMHLLRIQ